MTAGIYPCSVPFSAIYQGHLIDLQSRGFNEPMEVVEYAGHRLIIVSPITRILSEMHIADDQEEVTVVGDAGDFD